MKLRHALIMGLLLQLFGGLLSIELFAQDRIKQRLAAKDDVCNIDGIKIHYSCEGNGEPVILIHGFCANRHVQWGLPGITKMLAKDHYVVSYDNRGHGRSDKPHDVEQYGVTMVKDVIHLMDHLKIPKAHVVGYSMGGFITMKMMAEYPDRLLSATAGGVGWYQKEFPGNIDVLAESLEKGEGLTPLINFLTPPGQPKPDAERLKAVNKILMATNDPKALAACARGIRKLAVSEDKVKGNQVPLLVMIGDQDPLNAGLDELKKVKPHCHVVVLDQASHMNTFSKPEFMENLIKFLSNPGQFSPVKGKK